MCSGGMGRGQNGRGGSQETAPPVQQWGGRGEWVLRKNWDGGVGGWGVLREGQLSTLAPLVFSCPWWRGGLVGGLPPTSPRVGSLKKGAECDSRVRRMLDRG